MFVWHSLMCDLAIEFILQKPMPNQSYANNMLMFPRLIKNALKSVNDLLIVNLN